MDERPSYYAVIPASVRYDKRLRANEKLLYGELTALSVKTGECWASNNYFANLYDCTPQAVSKWVNNLEKYGYITTKIIYKEDGKEIDKRIICIAQQTEQEVSTNIDGVSTNDLEGINKSLIGVSTKDCGGYQQKFKENNTSINNTRINNTRINKRESKERKFTPPTLDEVQDYINERQLNVDGRKFFDYFDTGGWVDSRGNKVKNWKQKLLTWDSHAKTPRRQDTTPKKEHTSFSDFLEKEQDNDEERNNPDFDNYTNSISEILPEYQIE